MRFLFSLVVVIAGVFALRGLHTVVTDLPLIDGPYNTFTGWYDWLTESGIARRHFADTIQLIEALALIAYIVLSNAFWLWVGWKLWGWTRGASYRAVDSINLYGETPQMRFASYLFWRFVPPALPLLYFPLKMIVGGLMNLADFSTIFAHMATVYSHPKAMMFFGGCYAVLFLLWGLVRVIGTPIFAWFARFRDNARMRRGGVGRLMGYFEEVCDQYSGQSLALFYGNSLFAPWMRLGPKDERHMTTIGGSRGGKGAACIIPNATLWDGSAFIIDPKGTNANVTAAHRRNHLGQTVHIVDPYGIVDPQAFAGAKIERAGFNPLADIDLASPMAVPQIDKLAESLTVPEPGAATHFPESAALLFSGIIAHIVSDPAYPNPSLRDVFDVLMATPEKQAAILAEMRMNSAFGGKAQIAAEKFLRGGGMNEFNSILSTCERALKWLTDPCLVDAVTRSTFSFKALKEEKTTVYLVIPPNHLGHAKGFLRVFTNMAISQFVDGGKSPIPTLFLIDEAAAVGRLEAIEKSYGENASYNMVLWTFWQDKEQLDTTYRGKASTFLSSARAVQYFALTDAISTAFARERLGRSAVGAALNVERGGEILDMRQGADISVEIGADSGLMYVFPNGKRPMLIRRNNYFSSFWLRYQLDPDPDHPRQLGPMELIVRTIAFGIPALVGRAGKIAEVVASDDFKVEECKTYFRKDPLAFVLGAAPFLLIVAAIYGLILFGIGTAVIVYPAFAVVFCGLVFLFALNIIAEYVFPKTSHMPHTIFEWSVLSLPVLMYVALAMYFGGGWSGGFAIITSWTALYVSLLCILMSLIAFARDRVWWAQWLPVERAERFIMVPMLIGLIPFVVWINFGDKILELI